VFVVCVVCMWRLCVCVFLCVWCVQPTWLSDVAFTAGSMSAVSPPQSVPCYSTSRIRSHRHVFPVNKYKNIYCVFVTKLNIFTYDIYCSRGRGVILCHSAHSVSFRYVNTVLRRILDACWCRCQKCVLWLSFGCLVFVGRRILFFMRLEFWLWVYYRGRLFVLTPLSILSGCAAVWERSARVRVLVCVSVSFSWPRVARLEML